MLEGYCVNRTLNRVCESRYLPAFMFQLTLHASRPLIKARSASPGCRRVGVPEGEAVVTEDDEARLLSPARRPAHGGRSDLWTVPPPARRT